MQLHIGLEFDAAIGTLQFLPERRGGPRSSRQTLIGRRVNLLLALPLEKLEWLPAEGRVRTMGELDSGASAP